MSISVSGSAGALTITPASGTLDELVWTVNGDTTSTNGVQLLQYGSETVNLCLSSTTSNTAVRVSTGTSNNKWVMGDSGMLLKVQNVSRYLGEYVAGSDWRSYNSETAANYSNQSLVFYVLNSAAASYTVTYSENGVTSSETYTAGDAVSLKKAASEDGYTFIGWSTAEVPTATNTVPSTLITSTYTMPSADTTLYAVYAKATAGTSTSYVKTPIGSIKPADEVVITETLSDGTVYAMSNANGTSAAPSATAVTVSSDKLSATPGSTLLWNVLNLGGNLIIYQSGTTKTWLYCTSANNGVRVGTNDNNVFQIDSGSGYLKHIATGRYLGVYTTTPDWRCYTTTTTNIANQTLAFYVKAASYSGYTTSIVTTPSPIPSGDITATLVTSEAELYAGGTYLLLGYDKTNASLYSSAIVNSETKKNLPAEMLSTEIPPEIVTKIG
ncbi:MAG: InlB B-repeat-containing protein, partial [Eubacteriales bacterium]